MKAALITYSAKGLNKTEASKLSKKLLGYVDKSNKAQYTYKRKGLITAEKAIIIAKSVFIVPKSEPGKITKEISAFIDGKGGGKADIAQGGSQNVEKVDEIFDKVKEIVEINSNHQSHGLP